MLILGQLMEKQHTEDSKSHVLPKTFKSSASTFNSLPPTPPFMLCMKMGKSDVHVQCRHEDTRSDHPFAASKSTCLFICRCHHPYLPAEDHKPTLFWCKLPWAVISADLTAKQGSHLWGKLSINYVDHLFSKCNSFFCDSIKVIPHPL